MTKSSKVRSGRVVFATLVLSLSCLVGPAARVVRAAPPFSGTIFIDPDIVTPDDPTSYTGLVAGGQGMRTMFDRRVSGFIQVNAYLFDASFSDGLTIEMQVNPEFGDAATAQVEADKYAAFIGQLPTALRADVQTSWIHKGLQPFGGGNNNILIHTDQADDYVADGILEETLVHEASHSSLDDPHAAAAGWLDAQADDPDFISTYARDFPDREDVAETFLVWLAVRLRAQRISTALYDTIVTTVPNRLAYFDAQDFDLRPLVGNAGTRDDVDGDGKADVAVYDGETGTWQVLGSTDGPIGPVDFGGPGFKPVPGDYDGDGRTDLGIYEVATGAFDFMPAVAPLVAGRTSVEQRRVAAIGAFAPAEWLPAPADYDGDGKTDYAAYNQVTGYWRHRRSSDSILGEATLGGPGFLAAPADFDGDGRADAAVYQISTGAWSYVASKDGQQMSLPAFGGGGRFVPVPADYDGDGKADQALYQKRKGKWRFRFSSTGLTSNFTGIGGAGWVATPGDFDGDGKVDAGAYRKSTGGWRHQSSVTGLKTTLPTLGGPGLVPVIGIRPH